MVKKETRWVGEITSRECSSSGGALRLSDNPEGQESEGSKAVNVGWLSTGREETEL